MKWQIVDICWHNHSPILSVDIQPRNQATTANKNFYRLASIGSDVHVFIWHLKFIEKNAQNNDKNEAYEEDYNRDILLELVADLTRNQCIVNCVKWSPNGELLASGDDEGVICIWKREANNESSVNIVDEANNGNKEIWLTLKILRGHMAGIYDLSWSPNSLQLVSGSIDNSAIIWDVQEGKSVDLLNDHEGYVHRVAWDPKNQYIATLSKDRYLRIFDIQTKKVIQRIGKGCLPVDERHPLHVYLYPSYGMQTFFRRLIFTPDGKLLLTPSGVTDCDGVMRPFSATYIYTCYDLNQLAIVLPCPDQYAVAISCCPLLYRLRPCNAGRCSPIVPLPYRIIFAVVSNSSLYFYDTQHRTPYANISNIHYTHLTDITWSDDGLIVVVSSADGFCLMITFEPGELGELFEDQGAATSDLSNTSIKESEKKETDGNGGSDLVHTENVKAEPELGMNQSTDITAGTTTKAISATKTPFTKEAAQAALPTTNTINSNNHKITKTELCVDNDNTLEEKPDNSVLIENDDNNSAMIQLDEINVQGNSIECTEDNRLVCEEILNENSCIEVPKIIQSDENAMQPNTQGI